MKLFIFTINHFYYITINFVSQVILTTNDIQVYAPPHVVVDITSLMNHKRTLRVLDCSPVTLLLTSMLLKTTFWRIYFTTGDILSTSLAM